jgi:hypothetical protein
MTILSKLKQVFVPVNQPINFPRLYFIPETTLLQGTRQASNDPLYHQSQPTRITSPLEAAFRKHARIKMEIFQEACAYAWAAMKAIGRATVRWLARWVVLPLSVASALYIPSIHPMDLLLP